MALRLAPPLRACGGAFFFPRCGVVVSPRCNVPLNGPPATHTPENETWPETRFNYIVAAAFSPTPATQSITGFVFEQFAMVAPPEGLEVGWAVRSDYQRKGLALEAAIAVIGFGFDNIHVPEQVGITDVDNTPSQKLMDRLGFQFKESIDYGGRKNFVFSLSRETFRSNEGGST